jgi:cytochrome c553
MKRTILFFVAVVVVFLLSAFVLAADDAAALFETNCAKCHGTDGTGRTPAKKKMDVPDFHDKQIVGMSDQEMFDTIGRGTKHKTYPHTFLYTGLNEQQVHGLVAHIRKLQRTPAK